MNSVRVIKRLREQFQTNFHVHVVTKQLLNLRVTHKWTGTDIKLVLDFSFFFPLQLKEQNVSQANFITMKMITELVVP